MDTTTGKRRTGGWNWERLAAMAAVVASLGLLAIGQPSLADKLERLAPQLDTRLDRREVQIDAAELLDLMHNNQVRLLLLDLRDEAEFNLFHLLDAWNVTLEDLRGDLVARIHPETIVVLMSNDEGRATEAWRIARVQGLVNAYVLAGGINGWLARYGGLFEPRAIPLQLQTAGGEPLRYTFPVAIGDRTDSAWPDPHHLAPEEYVSKVKVLKPITLEGGGCG